MGGVPSAEHQKKCSGIVRTTEIGIDIRGESGRKRYNIKYLAIRVKQETV